MLKTGYYSVNDLKKILLPMNYSKGDIVYTTNGDRIIILDSNKVSEVIDIFDLKSSDFGKKIKTYTMNSRMYFGYIQGNSNISGVMIIHESDIKKD